MESGGTSNDIATHLPRFSDSLWVIAQVVFVIGAHGSRLEGDWSVDEVEIEVLQLEASQCHLTG